MDQDHPSKWVRKQGRPQHGRVAFKQANIDAIPKVGSMSDLARALTVKITTVQQWMYENKEYPIPFTIVKNESTGTERKRFFKDAVVRWLVNTNRFSPGPGYELKRR